MRYLRLFGLVCVSLMFVGCSSAPVSPEQSTATPDALLVTVAALQTQNAQLSTQVAGLPATLESLPTATTLPTQTPMPSATPAESIAPTATPVPTRAATPPAPQILSFTVDPGEVNPGEEVTLRWNAINTVRVVIGEWGQAGLDGPPTYGNTEVAPSGYWVRPIADRGLTHSTFRLEVFDLAGTSIWQDVVVNIRCTYSFFFGQPWRADCPSGLPSTSAAAEQSFEGGRMIWTAAGSKIMMLLNSGELVTYDDTWTDNQPANDPSIVPPAGRYQPVRGFGKIWRTAPTDIRDALGWALAPEQGYQTQLQSSAAGCRPISENGFYVSTINGRVIHVCPGDKGSGYWEDVTP